jgi:hypothetical protein
MFVVFVVASARGFMRPRLIILAATILLGCGAAEATASPLDPPPAR